MGIAFSGFRGKMIQNGLIWQEHDSLFPYQCSQCKRIFEKGGKRWLGSSMAKQIKLLPANAMIVTTE